MMNSLLSVHPSLPALQIFFVILNKFDRNKVYHVDSMLYHINIEKVPYLHMGTVQRKLHMRTYLKVLPQQFLNSINGALYIQVKLFLMTNT